MQPLAQTGSRMKREANTMKAGKTYSVPDLKGRGWTDTAIRKFLPTVPDDTRPNPKYRNAGAPMKFWLCKRVHRVEKSKRFIAWAQGTEKRKQAASKGVSKRAANMANPHFSPLI
jgi:hypothetical protein